MDYTFIIIVVVALALVGWWLFCLHRKETRPATFCKDCKFYSEDFICHNPQYAHTSLVSGKQVFSKCADTRSYDYLCGREGNGFEGMQ